MTLLVPIGTSRWTNVAWYMYSCCHYQHRHDFNVNIYRLGMRRPTFVFFSFIPPLNIPSLCYCIQHWRCHSAVSATFPSSRLDCCCEIAQQVRGKAKDLDYRSLVSYLWNLAANQRTWLKLIWLLWVANLNPPVSLPCQKIWIQHPVATWRNP